MLYDFVHEGVADDWWLVKDKEGTSDIDEDKGERAIVKEAYHRRRERGDVTGIRSTKIQRSIFEC